ncbi:MAG: UDP-N-acetylmuramoyl-L-alanyl-D-glutamate--2,6-diaminopimelate ligase [Planctomycetes bacterium]|nr:UDP-N-acetylmuramoyl-L-alanyl-D-glutamate--2,6-diaminopimelate ligase [Planctomycetota bacterium]
MRLSALLSAVEPKAVLSTYGNNGRDPEITGIACNSRCVQPGHLFVMIRGVRHDARDFANDAVRRGASAIVGETFVDGVEVPQYVVSDPRRVLADLASEFYGEPSRALTCVGITGTNGKSTTAYLLSSIYRALGDNPGLIGTLGHGIFGALVPGKNTTPDALTIQALLREFVERGSMTTVMEVSSHGIAQGRVRGIHFDAAVFTNLTHDHLDYHSSFDDYRETKARLFDELSPLAVAVLNADDESGKRMGLLTRARVVRYALDRNDVEWSARVLERSLEGSRFEVRGPSMCTQIQTRLLGRHNVMNCLAAAATAATLGVPEQAIRAGIESVSRVPGRLERVSVPGKPIVLVDYAHTDDALENVLRSLRPHVSGRLITVFGAGGDRDATKRPRMGRVVAELSDEIVITSDNPRSEDPAAIAAEVQSGMGSRTATVELDRRRAIERAIEFAQHGDAVLIAGKGHETYQVIGSQTTRFDDREVAREILSAR